MHADAISSGVVIPHARALRGGLRIQGQVRRLALSQNMPHGRTLDVVVLDGQQPGTSDVSMPTLGRDILALAFFAAL